MHRRRYFQGLLICILLVLTTWTASASYVNYFPIQAEPTSGSPGFKHDPPLRGDDIPAGLPLAGVRPYRSSPTIADIDGNLSNGKEVVIAGSDGIVYAYNRYGQLLWQTLVVPPCNDGLPPFDSRINSTPAVGALYGNGVPFVVIGYGTVANTNCPGGVVALFGDTGIEHWRYIVGKFAVNGNLDGVASAPALADTDGNGTLEVAFGAFDRNLYLLEANGTLRWRYEAFDTVWSSPAFANIDADPQLELIVGTDITGNAQVGTSNGGYVYAFDTNQYPSDKIIHFGTGYIWRNFYNQTIYSSPAVADLDRNGSLEVVIGSGCFYNNNVGAGRWVKVLDAASGNEISTLNAMGCSRSSPAVGDIDDDGQLEIVNISNGQFSGVNFSWVQAWDFNNPNPKWTTVPVDSMGNHDPNADDLNSVVIADLDGNGSLEVALAYSFDVVVLRGDTGVQLTCAGVPGNLLACGNTRSLFTWMVLKATPAIGDMDGDGDLEIVVGGHHAGADYSGTPNGYLYAWTNFAGLLGSPAGKHRPYSAPWPMFRGNASHTAFLRSPTLQAPAQLDALLQPNTQRSSTIKLSSSDGSPFSWTLSETDPANRFSLTPASGGLNYQASVQVTLSASNSAPTSYDGSVTIQPSTMPAKTIPVNIVTSSAQRFTFFIPALRQ